MHRVRGDALRSLVDRVVRLGADRESYVEALAARAIDLAADALPYADLVLAKDIAARRFGDDMGLAVGLAASTSLDDFGDFGGLLAGAHSIRDALLRARLGHATWEIGPRLDVVERADRGVEVTFEVPAALPTRGAHVECAHTLLVVVGLARVATARDISATVRSPVPWGASARAMLRRALGDTRVVVDPPGGRWRLLLPASVLGLPIRLERRDAPPLLPELLQRSPLAARDLRSRVETAILGTLPTRATLDAVARSTGHSPRGLQRALAGEGLEFRAVLDDVLRRRAEVLLGSGERVADVAEALGYASSTAFHRRYVAWTGETPGGGRPRHRRDDGEDLARKEK